MSIKINTPQGDPLIAPWRDAAGNEIADGAYLNYGDGYTVQVSYINYLPGTDEDRWQATLMMLPLTGGSLREFLQEEGREAVVTLTPHRSYEDLLAYQDELGREGIEA